MDFGVVFPTTQIGTDPAVVRDFARTAEGLGYRRLAVYDHVEYESLGVPFEGRDRRLDEQVDVLRRLWREPVVDYRGEFHRIDRAGIAPRPVRGDIPLHFGGGAEPALRRAARTGDGFVFGSASSHTHQRAVRLRELLAEQGRDPAAFPLETMIDSSLGPDVWAEQVSAWETSGGSVLSLRTMSTGADHYEVARLALAGPAAHVAARGAFVRVVRG